MENDQLEVSNDVLKKEQPNWSRVRLNVTQCDGQTSLILENRFPRNKNSFLTTASGLENKKSVSKVDTLEEFKET